MKDKTGVSRGKCTKCNECTEYIKEKDFNLCAYCEHTPVAHVVRTHDARSIEEISALEHVVDSGVPCSPVASTSAQDAVFEPLNESSTVQIDESVTIDGQQDNENTRFTFNESTPTSGRMLMESPASHSIIVTPDRMISPTGSWANESQVNMTSTTTPSSSTAAPSIQRMTSQQTNLFPNGLKSVLESCTDGQVILRAPELNYGLRCKLAGVVINHVIQNKEPKGRRPENCDVMQAANEIVALFPGEKMGVWFTPPIPGGKRISGGKLTEKLRNTWRMLNQFESSPSSSSAAAADNFASEIEVQDELNWLRYNIQPWTTVLTKWEKTSNYRITVLQSGVKSLSDFKLYGNPKVDSLVDIDFKAVCHRNGYSDCNENLFKEWPDIAGKLITYQDKRSSCLAPEDSIDDDIKAVKILVQLACSKRSLRLANSTAAKGKRKTWCPSINDCLQSFIIFAQDLDEAERLLDCMRQQYSLMDLKVNPLIFSLPTSTIVVCDNNRLVADSLIKGIDLCFKLIMIQNLEYNKASYPCWLFLQKYVYGIQSQWDVPSPKAEELATTLKL